MMWFRARRDIGAIFCEIDGSVQGGTLDKSLSGFFSFEVSLELKAVVSWERSPARLEAVCSRARG